MLAFSTFSNLNLGSRMCCFRNIQRFFLPAGSTQIESAAPTSTSDRACIGIVPYNYQTQYESVAATSTAQPVCADTSSCDEDTQYEAAAPTVRSPQTVCAIRWHFPPTQCPICYSTRSPGSLLR
jgi:hypothetical protein